MAHTIRSPLTLLEQWRDRADRAPLREMIIMGYTVDLSFLEKFVVPTARGLGARITVLGDPAQAVHDDVDVRRAGTAYQHGHAACRRAFHPKLVVLAGDEDNALAVGSGNPTLSGWGYNRELWVIAHGSREVGPQLIADVADWLQELPTVVTIASWIAGTLQAVADQIRPTSIDTRWASTRAYGNLLRPLLERIPDQSVEELRLAAPFFDPPAEAVKALVMRTRPRVARIAVQPSAARFDGAAIAQATSSAGNVEFRLVQPGALRHGKLIEWEAGGSVAGMTGSANITSSALLMTTSGGGNCELTVVAPHFSPLLPDGDLTADIVFRTMAADPLPPTASEGSAPALLGCAITDGILVVELASPAIDPILIEFSPSAVPGSWETAGTIAAGLSKARFLVPEVSGGAIRAVIDVNGTRHESTVVFITDPIRCRPRSDIPDEPRLSRAYETDDLFTDPLIAQRFTVDLERLVELVSATNTPAPASSNKRLDVREASADRWADYLDACDRRLGPALSQLIFPRRLSATVTTSSADWAIDDTDDNEVTDDEDETVLDDIAQDHATFSARSDAAIRPDQRRRYRRFGAQWAAFATGPRAQHANRSSLPPIYIRMTIAALYLTLLAEGVWREDEDWRRDLRWLVWALIPDDEVLDELPAEAFDHLFALLAVAMATLRQGTTLYGGRQGDLYATDAWRDASEWVAEANAELAEERLLPSTRPYAIVSSPVEVWDTILLAGQTKLDPYAEARENLAEAGLNARREADIWWVDGPGNAYHTAARAVTALSRVSGHAVVVARSARQTVLIALANNVMALADQARVWRIYPLSSTRTPVSLTSGSPGPPPGAQVIPFARQTPAEVRNLSDLVGVDLTAVAERIRSTL
ncbi:phospholipase D-like domain-containing protein [Asanoa ferruginea]|uniref:hypothetical protein n=1 Tax=Asanoa ferruginea TaxID=53367 RepID=UPI0011C0DCE7|nr:hypothetical protein [Asanoa ferruginea]